MGYKHLTTDLRCQIYTLESTGMKQKDIADHFAVSASTICRELKRNIGNRVHPHKEVNPIR